MIGLAGYEGKTVYKPNGEVFKVLRTEKRAARVQRLQHFIVRLEWKFESFLSKTGLKKY